MNESELNSIANLNSFNNVTPGPSKLEKVVDPGSGPRGPLPEIGVHYLVLFSWEILEGHHWCQT